MLILLPPSEGKTAPARGKTLDLASLSMPELTDARQQVLTALVELCEGDPAAAAKVLGLGKTQLGEVERNASLVNAPTARAEQVYTGVLYEALDLPSLTGADKRRAGAWIAVTSSLFGLVRPGDRIPAYRLSGDVTLPGLGSVAGHWRGALGPVAERAAGKGLVLDLRSTTYAAFWRPEGSITDHVATVRVLHEVDGARKTVSHFNKATKGRLVRALVTGGEQPSTPAELAEVLTGHGWVVETGAASKHGTRLDVVVSDL